MTLQDSPLLKSARDFHRPTQETNKSEAPDERVKTLPNICFNCHPREIISRDGGKGETRSEQQKKV